MADLSEDRAWLTAFREGDSDALERVFRTYARYVCAIVRRGVFTREGCSPPFLDQDIQDDLLQEVFVRVLSPEMRKRYDGVRPYAWFLGGVTRHVVIDYARRTGRLSKRQEEFDENLIPEDWMPAEPLPDQSLLAQEEQRAVNEFLTGLNTDETAFVDLRFAEGASQRDTASKLGLSRQRVRTLEEKIRSRFKGFLEKKGF